MRPGKDWTGHCTHSRRNFELFTHHVWISFHAFTQKKANHADLWELFHMKGISENYSDIYVYTSCLRFSRRQLRSWFRCRWSHRPSCCWRVGDEISLQLHPMTFHHQGEHLRWCPGCYKAYPSVRLFVRLFLLFVLIDFFFNYSFLKEYLNFSVYSFYVNLFL